MKATAISIFLLLPLTYAPIFIPEGFEKPMGDMEEEEFAKTHNHRDLAMEELVKKFKELGY